MRLAPRIHLLALDPEVRPLGEFLIRNLDSMRDSVIDVGIALDLWEFAREAINEHGPRTAEGQRYIGWGRLAASNIAINLSSIYEVMQANSSDLIYRLPIVDFLLDQLKMSHARAMFAQRFDGMALVRHDAAHPDELGATPEKGRIHQAETGQIDLGGGHKVESIGPTCMSGEIISGRYMCTVNGRMMSLVIDRQLGTDLEAIITTYFDAFNSVPEATEALSLARREQTR